MNLNEAYAHYERDQIKDAKAATNELCAEIRAFAFSKASRRRNLDADSIAQDVTMRVLNTLDRFDPKRGNFRAWVATYTNNYMSTCHRKAKRQMKRIYQETEEQPLQELAPVYIDDVPPFRDESSLPPDMQRIVALLTLGYTKEEIAIRMNISMRTIQRRIAQYIAAKEAA